MNKYKHVNTDNLKLYIILFICAFKILKTILLNYYDY